MKTKELTTLDEVLKFLNDIPNINCGGCGISAYSVYLWLKARNLITPDFKFILAYKDYSSDEYLNNEEVIKNNNGNVLAPSHMFIQYNKKYIDSNGPVNRRYFKWFHHLNPDDKFIVDCLKSNNWNWMFDRKQYKPIIEDVLEIQLPI